VGGGAQVDIGHDARACAVSGGESQIRRRTVDREISGGAGTGRVAGGLLPLAFRPFGKQGYITMKKTFALGIAAGLISLSACNTSPREQAADNIEANSEAVADNLEEAADNATTEAGEDALENRADAVRATGQNQAEDMRTNDADTNLSNGL
jgi:hypothetical protein